MKYVPTKNLAQVWYYPDKRKAFEDAAWAKAQEEFLKELLDEEYRSVADYKEFLKEFTEADINHDIIELQEERDDLQVSAGHPDITPERSFQLLVESYVKSLYVQAHDEVLNIFK